MTAIMRTPLVLPVAATVSVGLFMMMRGLIDIGPVELVEAVEPPSIEIRFDIEEPDPERSVTPDDIADVEPPPPPARVEVDTIAPSAEPQIAGYVLPSVETGGIEISTGVLASPDQTPSPIVRVEPIYPVRAASRGLEGQCMIIFDITPQGTTANVRIMSCTNTAFERTSINAISRWRYNPQVQNGAPVVFRGATTQLVYRLD